MEVDINCSGEHRDSRLRRKEDKKGICSEALMCNIHSEHTCPYVKGHVQ